MMVLPCIWEFCFSMSVHSPGKSGRSERMISTLQMRKLRLGGDQLVSQVGPLASRSRVCPLCHSPFCPKMPSHRSTGGIPSRITQEIPPYQPPGFGGADFPWWTLKGAPHVKARYHPHGHFLSPPLKLNPHSMWEHTIIPFKTFYILCKILFTCYVDNGKRRKIF